MPVPLEDDTTSPPESDAGIYLSSIRRTGNALHLIDSTGHETVCLPNGRGFWIPVNSDAFIVPGSVYDPEGPDYDPTSPPDPDEPSDSSIQSKLIAWHKARLGKFRYSQNTSGRLNPDKSGYTDCSGLQYACYKKVTGKNVGTNSRDQANNGHGGRVVTTDRSDILHGRGMQKGDLIFYAHPGATWSHVEMYMGNQKVIGISNVHQKGSRIQALSLQVNYFKGKLKVKRYV